MGYNNHAQSVTGPNYLDVDNPFHSGGQCGVFSQLIEFVESIPQGEVEYVPSHQQFLYILLLICCR